MQRHDTYLRFGRAVGRRHQIFERRAEHVVIAEIARALVHAQQREEAFGCIEIERFCNARRAAKPKPCAAHPGNQRRASTRLERRADHRGETLQSRSTFRR